MNKLQEIAARRREAIAADKARQSHAELDERARAAPPARGFREALRNRAPTAIAEIKRASPSAGDIRADASAAKTAVAYQRGGAAALSVLTEPDYFRGDISDLVEARIATDLPVLRKDFIVDPWQILDSRAAGADAILLIVAILGDAVRDYLAAAQDYGLDALVEVHDESELDTALGAGADIVGVNNRDLRDLSIDLSVTERLAARIPRGKTLVAESGVRTRDDARRMFTAGAHAVLVGSSLMEADSPGAALASLLGREPGREGEEAGDLDKDLRHHAA